MVASAQLYLDCGGVKQKIPYFKKDSIAGFDKKQPLIAMGVIPSLKKSSSTFEIRVLNHGLWENITLIIKCEDGRIVADRYETYEDIAARDADTTYKNVGKINYRENLYVKHTKDLKLKNGDSWNIFLKD